MTWTGEIDYVAERGLGAWLKARREKKGLSAVEVAQASSIASRTVQRYEQDEGLGYETLRVLDALGVKLRPAPPRSGPISVNGELRLLRQELGARAAADDARHVEFERRLEALEGRVVELAALVVRALDSALGARPGAGDGESPRRAAGSDG